jgi:hybrid cluster-associated redox disulfide protein
MKKKITKSTPVGEAITSNPKAVTTFLKHGLGCAGCPLATSETIEQGALSHGLSKKALSNLLKELNKS